MRMVCDSNMCNGCMACVEKCPKKAIKIQNGMFCQNAEIDESLCIKCGLCETVCPVKNSPKVENPLLWKQGWSLDQETRKNAASGGIASEIIKSFVRNKGAVCACTSRGLKFNFQIVRSEKDLDEICGSKYVKSNPQDIYKPVYDFLKNGKKVLFIGLPCQVAAIKNYVGQQLCKDLYTVDLICHGTPSIKLFHQYVSKFHYKMDDVKYFSFRKKKNFFLSFEKKKQFLPADGYIAAFLYGFSYTENCYSCKFAQQNRVSDITLGDSWGTINCKELEKGVSLILCQNEKGEELLNDIKDNVYIEDVNIDIAKKNNKQLSHPTIPPTKRNYFVEKVLKGVSVDRLMYRLLLKVMLKQRVKYLLVTAKNFLISNNK